MKTNVEIISRTGSCLNCGKCCQGISLTLHNDDSQNNDERNDYTRWLNSRSNIILRVNKNSTNVYFKMPCKYLAWDRTFNWKKFSFDYKSRCSIYEHRPEVCKRFPEEENFICQGIKFTKEGIKNEQGRSEKGIEGTSEVN